MLLSTVIQTSWPQNLYLTSYLCIGHPPLSQVLMFKRMCVEATSLSNMLWGGIIGAGMKWEYMSDDIIDELIREKIYIDISFKKIRDPYAPYYAYGGISMVIPISKRVKSCNPNLYGWQIPIRLDLRSTTLISKLISAISNSNRL